MSVTPEFLEKKIKRLMNEVLENGKVPERNDPTRVQRLRVSSFPFCGVRWFLNLPSSTADKRNMDTAMGFYVSVGHAVHNTFQTALAGLDLEDFSIQVLGDWRCVNRECNHVHRMSLKMDECVKCGSAVKFGEVELSVKSVFGHIDKLLILKVPKSKEYPDGYAWLVCDYKTTATRKINSKKAPTELAGVENKAQVRAYVSLLHDLGKPVLPYAVLIYVSRDDPNNFMPIVVPVDFDQEREAIKGYRKQFKLATQVEDRDDLKELVTNRPCAGGCLPEFEWCRWRHHCAGAENSKVVLRELDTMRVRLGNKIPIVNWTPVKGKP